MLILGITISLALVPMRTVAPFMSSMLVTLAFWYTSSSRLVYLLKGVMLFGISLSSVSYFFGGSPMMARAASSDETPPMPPISGLPPGFMLAK